MKTTLVAAALALVAGSATYAGAGKTDARPLAPVLDVPATTAAALPQELPEGVTSEMVEQGKQIFDGPGICFSCHMPEGAGGPLAPALNDDEWLHIDGSYPQIVELIKTGVSKPVQFPAPMMPRGGTQITDEQVAAVAAYVWTLSHGS